MIKQFKNGIIHGVGILSVLTIAGITYATVNSGEPITAQLFNESMVPSGAVMAFNSNTCPTGWSEYTLAYGRFIRGIDKGTTPIDPEGQRIAGDIQTDEFAAHNHTGNTNTTGAHSHGNGITSGGNTYRLNGSYTDLFATNTSTSSAGNHSHTLTINNTGGDETRPDNVALLYCEKN